jgi:hypothetical protein
VKGGESGVTDGQREWSWSYQNPEIVKPEASEVSVLDYGPMVVATTFADYGALAAAYDSRAREKAKVTPPIKQLADQLTHDASTPREQAKAIYDWVAINITYAPNTVGTGSWVPHSAEEILTNRMGDCKDHTTLMKALLAAKGIASVPVLINGGTAYDLPPVTAPGLFSHLIIYLPSLDLYADSTSRFTPFGSLPLDDYDKPVVHTEDYTELRRTPATDPKTNTSAIETGMNFHGDGTADGETKVQAQGLFSDGLRAAAIYLQPNMEDSEIRQSLAAAGYSGTGKLTEDDPKILKDGYSYSVKYQLDEAIHVPGPSAMPIRSPIGASAGISNFLGELSQPDRTRNFQCVGGTSTESITIHLPKGVEVMAIPKDARIEGKSAIYKASYRQQGDTVTIVREMDDHTRGNVCTPEYAKEFKTFSAKVRRNLDQEILYR